MAPAGTGVALATVSLDDKYALDRGRVFLTGTQAIVRLLILQQQRDKLAGLNTGGFVSGYRGSPLGGVDQALWSARKFLERANVRFQPGLNVGLGKDDSLFAKIGGRVRFEDHGARGRKISVLPIE